MRKYKTVISKKDKLEIIKNELKELRKQLGGVYADLIEISYILKGKLKYNRTNYRYNSFIGKMFSHK